MKFYLAVFGCQMNSNDADRLRTILLALGGEEAKTPVDAHLVFFITCSIKQHAEDRIFGLMRETAKKGKILAITGCMARITSTRSSEKRDGLFARTPLLDLVFRIQDAPKLPRLLRDFFPIPAEFFGSEKSIFDTLPSQKENFRAFVPISTGCDHRCTFCIVPYARGAEVCRSERDILKECQTLITNGAQEITLLGQNVNRWYRAERNKNPYKTDFAQLLEKIAQLPNLRWLRFLSPHPQHLGDDVLEIMAKYDSICKHLHLPIQSGDDEILRKMARGYTVAQFQKITQRAQKLMPNISITTDVIVGFCGETIEQFENSKKICAEEKFDMNYIGKFSVRPGTPAAKWNDDISHDEKKRRFHELNEVLKKTAKAKNKMQIGKTAEVLIDAVDEKNHAKGHSNENRTVFFDVGHRGKEAVGQFVRVKITGAETFFLTGEVMTKKI